MYRSHIESASTFPLVMGVTRGGRGSLYRYPRVPPTLAGLSLVRGLNFWAVVCGHFLSA